LFVTAELEKGVVFTDLNGVAERDAFEVRLLIDHSLNNERMNLSSRFFQIEKITKSLASVNI
jgi:hypothetical protein